MRWRRFEMGVCEAEKSVQSELSPRAKQRKAIVRGSASEETAGIEDESFRSAKSREGEDEAEGAGGGGDARPSRPGAIGVGRGGRGRHHLARR